MTYLHSAAWFFTWLIPSSCPLCKSPRLQLGRFEMNEAEEGRRRKTWPSADKTNIGTRLNTFKSCAKICPPQLISWNMRYFIFTVIGWTIGQVLLLKDFKNGTNIGTRQKSVRRNWFHETWGIWLLALIDCCRLAAWPWFSNLTRIWEKLAKQKILLILTWWQKCSKPKHWKANLLQQPNCAAFQTD